MDSNKIIPSSIVLQNYETAKLELANAESQYGTHNWRCDTYRQKIRTYERKYDLRPVDPAKKQAAEKHYVEMGNGTVKVRLNESELHISMDTKVKYSHDTIETIKKDLDAALAIVAAAAKMDEKLRPQSSIEL